METRKVVRAGAWTAVTLLALLAMAYLVLVIVNWNDEAPSADAERFAAIGRDRPPLADEANGYIHALGLDAALDLDPVAVGSARSALVEAPSSVQVPDGDADARAADGIAGRKVDYRAARDPETAALAAACGELEARPCVEALDADPEALARWLAAEHWLLERYRRMLDTDAWREAIPVDGVPQVGYMHVLEAQKLHLLAAWRQAQADDPVAVRDLLDRDLAFWRRALASSDLLITKMVAAAAVRRSFVMGGLALGELPPELVDQAVPPSWRQPMTVDERSLARALAGEWRFARYMLDLYMTPDLEGMGPGKRLATRLQSPLFQHQATLNLMAARMTRLGALSERAYPEAGVELRRLGQPQEEGAGVRLRAYNTVGTLLDSPSADAGYASYVGRLSDLEGLRRASLLASELRGAGVTRDGAEDALRVSELRNPYDGTPFEWDAVDGAVVFRGVEPSPRGRYAIPL